ncbi:hypothetical protein Tco_0483060, partial [Tanacetum coccineum]
FGEDAFDDIDDLVDKGMDFVQEKDTENQGKIGADYIEVVKGSGDMEVLWRRQRKWFKVMHRLKKMLK